MSPDLVEGLRAIAFRKLDDVERLPIIRLRAHAAVEARDGLHVVVEDVGRGVEDAGDGVQVAAKIGGQDFDASIGEGAAHFTNGLGEVMRASIGQVVTIDGSDDDVAELHVGGHARDVGWLIGVEHEFFFCGGTFGDGAESAAPGAEVAEDHEGGGAAMKALMHVGAARGFADGVEVEAAQVALEVVDGDEVGVAFTEPLG